MRPYLKEMAEPRSSEPVVLLNEVFPGDTNALDTLFGGRLMSIMDTAAGMAASQFAHNEFVTVSVDALKFKRPHQGDVIRTIARVVWTSRRTVGVLVRSCRMTRSNWDPEEICSGFFSWLQSMTQCDQWKFLNSIRPATKRKNSGLKHSEQEMLCAN